MSTNGYQYVIELFREDDSPLGQASVKVDWGPAEEWARFQALRRGLLASKEPGRVAAIEPIWLREVGEPYLEGFRVKVVTDDGDVAIDFSSSYFKALATQASSHFIDKGRLENGQKFRYLAAAFRREAEPASGARLQFTTEEVAPSIAIRDSSLGESLAESVPHGTICVGDVPVFVPQRVLDEAAVLSRSAGARETGGILIGHLHRDATVPEVFVEVTAQIHARHTEADLTKLTFTAETWTEVQAAIDLRRKSELMLGWWHSHPVREWCRECPVERQQVCRMAGDFFSAHDHALHRTVFPSAHSIALVANDLATGDVTFSAFGWRDGLLESRGFHIAREARRAAPAQAE
ncbi:MAG TPA: Mov34/MPN/PAD-1 family protein [Blastocatellia bacterium]|nr:Mov34/MPN/PAD-1 family protein [Blastocatellia bacterium]